MVNSNPKPETRKKYMYKGERLNSISHLIGAVLAIAGLAVLVVFAVRQGSTIKIVSMSIYGTTLVLLFTFSTLHHSLKGKAKQVFLKLDYSSIYLLIAGAYTPLTLVLLGGGWGWSIFGTIWALAIVGIILECIPQKGLRILPIGIYLFMGWLILVALKPLYRVLPPWGFVWLTFGGLCYTVGVVFYVYDEKVRHFHGIWHLFVLAGSLSHFFAVFYYVLL